MRPLKLEMQGFTAFRLPTVVDFEGTDTFALSGPTGAGKSSIIDAITFALYGSIARYDDTRLVDPVVSQGMVQMKVCLHFEVMGQTYTATRVVRRTASERAATREVRLESGEVVLAASIREMAEKVKALLGLDFDQFNTCVVLPQGQFARFLRETPSKRQDLLKDLLSLHLYSRIGTRAREKAAAKDTECQMLQRELEQIPIYSKEMITAAQTRGRKLQDLHVWLTEREKVNRQLEESFGIAQRDLERLILLLRRLERPDLPDTAGLVTDVEAASIRRKALKDKWDGLDAQRETIEHQMQALPDTVELMQRKHAWEDLEKRRQQLEQLLFEIKSAAAEVDLGKELLAARQVGHQEADQAYQLARQQHLRHDLLRGLAPDDPCPICEQPLQSVPEHDDTGLLEPIRAQVTALAAEVQQTERQLMSHEARHQSLLARAEQDRAACELPDVEQRKEQYQRDVVDLKSRAQLEVQLAGARQAAAQARREFEAVEADLQALERQLQTAWDRFETTRDAVAELSPPRPDRGDLQLTLRQFSAWAESERRRMQEEVERQTLALNTLATELAALNRSMAEAMVAEGLPEPEPGQWRDVVTAAVGEQENVIRKAQEASEKRQQWQDRLDVARAERDLLRELGGHLRANGFERWLLQESFSKIVHDAGQRLYELSSGDYSFALDDSLNFDVIDHRNANEVRSCRTLSGGETFLASLALALSLADQIAGMSPTGGARLESMFLDEGFGTLDADTLDVVAATIESLSAGGRMIGLVTHVQDLAERMPVQYKVLKGPETATVERVLS